MRRSTSLSFAAAAPLALWALAVLVQAPVAAGAPNPACGNIYAQRDLSVGLPTLTVAGRSRAGAIDLFRTDGGKSRISAAVLAGSGGAVAGGRFGSAVVIQDTDHDGCEDLLVGSPGAVGGHGAVYLIKGAPGTTYGVDVAHPIRIASPNGAAGDDFGATVATSTVYSDGTQDLWIGAPGATVSGKAQAGVVYHYVLNGGGEATFAGTLSYDSAGVPGAARAGDRFGSVLSAEYHGIVVGVPRRDVGGHADAGEVVSVRAHGITPVTAQAFSQDSPGIAGAAEAGDQFGASVSVELLDNYIEDGLVAVGAPGEDVGRARDAGGAEIFADEFNGTNAVIKPVRGYGQNSPGVPGTAETGDRFGASVSVQTHTEGEDKYVTVAVGQPGESIGPAIQAGSVTLLTVTAVAPTSHPPVVYYQGHGLAGANESGDHVGATLSTIKGNEQVDDHPDDQFLVGIPGEDGAQQNSGIVQSVYLRQAPKFYASTTGPITGIAYGTVLGTAGPGDQLVP